jgi:hypothetical protein
MGDTPIWTCGSPCDNRRSTSVGRTTHQENRDEATSVCASVLPWLSARFAPAGLDDRPRGDPFGRAVRRSGGSRAARVRACSDRVSRCAAAGTAGYVDIGSSCAAGILHNHCALGNKFEANKRVLVYQDDQCTGDDASLPSYAVPLSSRRSHPPASSGRRGWAVNSQFQLDAAAWIWEYNTGVFSASTRTCLIRAWHKSPDASRAAWKRFATSGSGAPMPNR